MKHLVLFLLLFHQSLLWPSSGLQTICWTLAVGLILNRKANTSPSSRTMGKRDRHSPCDQTPHWLCLLLCTYSFLRHLAAWCPPPHPNINYITHNPLRIKKNKTTTTHTHSLSQVMKRQKPASSSSSSGERAWLRVSSAHPHAWVSAQPIASLPRNSCFRASVHLSPAPERHERLLCPSARQTHAAPTLHTVTGLKVKLLLIHSTCYHRRLTASSSRLTSCRWFILRGFVLSNGENARVV